MTHEVRTALNGVVGLSDLLLGTDLRDFQRAYATAIRASGETLLALVEKLVALSMGELVATDSDPSCSPVVAGGSSPTKLGQRGRVLVVDDNVVNQKVAARTLEKMGYAVDVVANGAEAVAAVVAVRYAAVVMDCHMPEMDGYEAAREIRRLECDRHTPIIAMTAGATPEDEARCRKSGMDDYLTKPLQRVELELALRRWASDGNDRTASADPRGQHRRTIPSIHPPAPERPLESRS